MGGFGPGINGGLGGGPGWNGGLGPGWNGGRGGLCPGSGQNGGCGGLGGIGGLGGGPGGIGGLGGGPGGIGGLGGGPGGFGGLEEFSEQELQMPQGCCHWDWKIRSDIEIEISFLFYPMHGREKWFGRKDDRRKISPIKGRKPTVMKLSAEYYEKKFISICSLHVIV